MGHKVLNSVLHRTQDFFFGFDPGVAKFFPVLMSLHTFRGWSHDQKIKSFSNEIRERAV